MHRSPTCCTDLAEGFSQTTAADRPTNNQSAKRSRIAALLTRLAYHRRHSRPHQRAGPHQRRPRHRAGRAGPGPTKHPAIAYWTPWRTSTPTIRPTLPPAGSPADQGCYCLARHCRTSLSLRMDPPRLTGPTQEQVCVTGSKLPHSQSQLLHYHGRNPQISERLSMIWLFWPEPRVRLGSARPDACCHVGPTLK